MKKRWTIFFISIGAVICLLLAVLLIYLGNSSRIHKPEFVFLYAENQPEDYPTSLGAHYFADEVYKRTDGRIQILIKTSGELGTEKEIIDQLGFGGIDFARVSLSQLAEKIPEMNILQLPYLYRDSDHMWRVLEGEIGDDFLKLTAKKNLVGLSWYDAGARSFYSRTPIRRIEDVKNLKIRVQESELMAAMIEAMGAVPAKISYDEVYSSLERGIVDAAENNWSSYIFMQHDEVAGFFTLDEHTRVPELQLCSEHTWELLSDEDRKIILECAKESALYERELWNIQEQECIQKAIENGVEIIMLTERQKQDFRAAMTEIYEQYAGEQRDFIEKILQY